MSENIYISEGKELLGLSNIVVSEVDGKIYINSSLQIDKSIKGSLAIYSKDDSSLLIGSGADCIWNKDDKVLEVINVESRSITSEQLKTKLVLTDCIESTAIETDSIKLNYADAGYIKAECLKVDSIVTEAVTSVHNKLERIESEFLNVSDSLKSRYTDSDFIKSECIECISVTSEVSKSDFMESDKFVIDRWIGFKSTKSSSDAFKINIIVHPQSGKEILAVRSENNKSSLIMGFEEDRIIFAKTTNLQQRSVPTSLGTPGDTRGDFCVDESFVYYCIKDYDGLSKIWKRSPLENW